MIRSNNGPFFHFTRSQRIEVLALFGILTFTIFSRLWKWDGGLTPFFFPSEYSLIIVEQVIESGTFWETWNNLFFNFQGQYNHELAGLFPIDYLAQRIFGLSFTLPLFVGCFWGTLSVIAVWWFGRITTGSLFGITLAALVAVSPLQIVWSRLGMKFEPSVAYCFFTLGVAFLAGKQKNVFFLFLAAILTWGSLYQYYLTRILFAATFLALCWGLFKTSSRRRDLFIYPMALGSIVAFVYMLVARDLTFSETIWPAFPGIGNYGEKSLSDLVFQNLSNISINAKLLFETYFLNNRLEGAVAMRHYWFSPIVGGTCLAPIVILGGLGFLVALSHPRTNFFWLSLTFLSFLPSVMSAASARRLLLFDVCWNVFAALFILQLFAKLRWISVFRQITSILGVSSLVGIYALYVIGRCYSLLPLGPTSIPFSFSLPGDVVTCLRCSDASRQWKNEILENNVVILVDADLGTLRENPTAPAGLNYFGKLQAAALGKPDYFIDFTEILVQRPNLNRPLLSFRHFVELLKHFVSLQNAPDLIWYFERPTQWERWFVDRIVEFGGEFSHYETPLASLHVFESAPFNPALVNNYLGIRVRLSAEAAPAFISWLEEHFSRSSQTNFVSLRAIEQRRELPYSPRIIGETNQESVAIPVQTGDRVLLESQLFQGPPWKSLFRESPSHIRALDEWATEGILSRHGVVAKQFPHPNHFINENCGTYADNQWWIANVLSGEIINLDRTEKIQGLRAIGVGRLGDEKLLIASANQKVSIYNLHTRSIEREFPANVQPSLLSELDGCTYIRAGKNWIALLNESTNSLHIFDMRGVRLAAINIDELLGFPSRALALGAYGNTLVIADNNGFLYSFELQLLTTPIK